MEELVRHDRKRNNKRKGVKGSGITLQGSKRSKEERSYTTIRKLK